MRRPRSLMVVAAGVLGLTAAAGTGAARAQHAMPPAVPGGPQAHLLANACASAFEANVATGRGFGMAFAADKNGYPGPTHVLELRDRLKLTPEQTAKIEALETAMFAESRPKSARLLDAEAKLGRLFASGRADESAIRAAVAEAERARADVRVVHLMTHLKAREILTDEQRRLYEEARWSAHPAMGPHGGAMPGAGAPMK